jgi:Protein of unknown function (DUF1203)
VPIRSVIGMSTIFTGTEPAELRRVLADGVDHGGNPIEPFIDGDGGWPLRCCLSDSQPGERIAIIAWSPMPWSGAYAETGPIVVHADGCEQVASMPRLPSGFDSRAMVLRPYGPDRRIAYHRVLHVPAGASLTESVDELLACDDVDFVHGRNVTGGCYAFTAVRATD